MCHNINVVNQTKSGIVVTCAECNHYQVLFKNLNFNFSLKEYSSFVKYLTSIDGEAWEHEYENSIYGKKIPIPTAQQNLMILLNIQELEELKRLLINKNLNKIKNVTLCDIDYKMIFN